MASCGGGYHATAQGTERLWRLGPVVLAALIPSFAAGTGVGAQERVVVPEPPACDCVLHAELVTTIEDGAGQAGLSQPLAIERLPSGDHLVVTAQRQGTLLRFDDSGRFVGELGGEGGGPGEFRSIVGMRLGRADSVLVMDPGNARLTVLSPGLVVARTGRLPAMGGWFGALADGGVLVLTGIPRTGSPGRLVRVGPSMQAVESFMPSPPVGAEHSVASLRRRIGVSASGVVAVTHWERYVVEIWNADGRHVRTLVREPDWFSDGTAAWDGQGPRPPQATLEWAPRVDGAGRVWTTVRIPDLEWEASRDVGSRSDGFGVGLRPGRLGDYYDTVVEVIDPEAGRLVAALQLDPDLTLVSDDGYAASYREDDLGLPFIDIWRLTVHARD